MPTTTTMKTLEMEFPDALAVRLEELIEEGWFTSEAEIVRLTLADFIRRRPFELQESLERLGVPVRLGPATRQEARDEVKVARDIE